MKIAACLLPLSILIFPSCSGKQAKEIEKGEGEQATLEAAIMEGRRAARPFLNCDTTDTLGMQALLLDARAKQSQYIMEGKTDRAEAFDTAFIHTLRAVNPPVARAVEKIKQQ